jgi:hypothetical protein
MEYEPATRRPLYANLDSGRASDAAVPSGLEQHADSSPASKFVAVGSATGADDRLCGRRARLRCGIPKGDRTPDLERNKSSGWLPSTRLVAVCGSLQKRWHVRRRTVAEPLYVELAFRSLSAVSEQRVSVMQLASTVKVDECMRLTEWFGSNDETVRQTLLGADIKLRLPWESQKGHSLGLSPNL